MMLPIPSTRTCEPGLFHPGAHQVAPRPVLGGEGQALGATLGGGADFRQPGERIEETGTVDTQLRAAFHYPAPPNWL